jgi:methylated-DNA-[protein]-cysteine S-methyltransferase
MSRPRFRDIVDRRVHTFIDSPVGTLTLMATEGGLGGLFMTDQRRCPPTEQLGKRDPRPFPAVIDQLGAYFAGELTTFDLPLAAVGTPFQRSVWAALRRIPYGLTRSYGQLAQALGRPEAARAVGAANGANPLGIIVPCHRVVGADGSLTGYGGGVERKRFLLELERRRAAPRLFSDARSAEAGDSRGATPSGPCVPPGDEDPLRPATRVAHSDDGA